MPIVGMPNGDQVSFPDDMPKDQIKDLISKKFPNDVASHLEDTASAIRSGMSWGQVAKSAVSNIPSSAGQMVSDIASAVAHPIDTAENLGAVGKGVLQKVGLWSGDDSVKYADAVGKFFKDRYGSEDGIKQAIAKDPVGVLADVATVISGGGTLAAKAPGLAGKVGEIAAATGRAIDPLTAAGKGVKAAGGLASEVLGITTGAGGEAIRTAARSGAEGGEASRTFLENLTGKSAPDAVVAEAKGAVAKLRDERGIAYRDEMAKLGTNPKVLDFDKIDSAVSDVAKVKTFKGVVIDEKTQSIRDELTKAVSEWRILPNAYHTVEGLDALKQKIGTIRDATQYGTPERVVADNVYHAVRSTIVKEAPEYAKIMKGYEEASTIIKEVEKTLSLNPKASIDTSLRKLQSVLRNNVSTNFGKRAELVEFLQKSGAPNLMNKLAGQALSSVAPRGLGRLSALGDISGAAAALAAHNPAVAAGLVGALGASSPLLVGGAAFGAGAASRVARPVARGAFQAGRLPQN